MKLTNEIKREYQVDYSANEIINAINFICSIPGNKLYKLVSYNELTKSFEIEYASKSILGTSSVKIGIHIYSADERKTTLAIVGSPSGNSFHEEILDRIANDAIVKILEHLNKYLNNKPISNDEFSKGDVNPQGCFGLFIALFSLAAGLLISLFLVLI